MTQQVLKVCIFTIGLQRLITQTRIGIVRVSQSIILCRKLLTLAVVFQEVIQLLGKRSFCSKKFALAFLSNYLSLV